MATPPTRIKIMKKILLLATLALLATTSQAGPGEDRQKAFKQVLRSFEPMGVMLRGSGYRKDVFIKHADALKAVAAAPFSQFKPGTIDDVSRAKPAIWSEPAKWKAEQDKFLLAVDQLQKTARGDDLAAIRRDYGAVAASCKACHDSFRGPMR